MGIRSFFRLHPLLLFTFTGCSSATENVEKRVEDTVMQKLLSDEDYQAYLQMKENGELGSENQYISDAPSILDVEGKVHVTFAENAYLKVSYFHDAELTEPVDENASAYRSGISAKPET